MSNWWDGGSDGEGEHFDRNGNSFSWDTYDGRPDYQDRKAEADFTESERLLGKEESKPRGPGLDDWSLF